MDAEQRAKILGPRAPHVGDLVRVHFEPGPVEGYRWERRFIGTIGRVVERATYLKHRFIYAVQSYAKDELGPMVEDFAVEELEVIDAE